MPDSEQPPPPRTSRIGDAIDAAGSVAKTVAGWSPVQVLMVAFFTMLIGAGALTAVFGWLFIQQQKETATQNQMIQREIASQLARTIESESEKNRAVIDSNTKLVVQSTQTVALTMGRLQTTLAGLERTVNVLNAKFSKTPPDEELEEPIWLTAPMPRPKAAPGCPRSGTPPR